MADTPTDPAPNIMNNTLKGVIAGAVMLSCMVTIGYLVFEGKPDNSLHASALSWSYTMIAGILAGLGLGAIASLVPQMIGKK